MIIAIDGPAASGKGTIAKQIAAVYGLHHLDTGLIYRAVAKAVLDGGHLLYYAIELIQGRPLARRFQEYGFRVGMAIIAMIMTSAILSDIYKWLLTLKS